MKKEVAALFEQTIPSEVVVQHPTLGRIDYRELDVEKANWLVDSGFSGLKRKEKQTAIAPATEVAALKNTDSKP
jgi:hypothetical protein